MAATQTPHQQLCARLAAQLERTAFRIDLGAWRMIKAQQWADTFHAAADGDTVASTLARQELAR